MRKWSPGRFGAIASTCWYWLDSLVEQALALVRFARGLVQPDRVRRDAREPDRLQVGVVPEQSPVWYSTSGSSG